MGERAHQATQPQIQPGHSSINNHTTAQLCGSQQGPHPQDGHTVNTPSNDATRQPNPDAGTALPQRDSGTPHTTATDGSLGPSAHDPPCAPTRPEPTRVTIGYISLGGQAMFPIFTASDSLPWPSATLLLVQESGQPQAVTQRGHQPLDLWPQTVIVRYSHLALSESDDHTPNPRPVSAPPV